LNIKVFKITIKENAMYYIKHIVIDGGRISVKPQLPALDYWGSCNIPKVSNESQTGYCPRDLKCVDNYDCDPIFDHFVNLNLEVGENPEESDCKGYIVFIESDRTSLSVSGTKLFDLEIPAKHERRLVLVLKDLQYVRCGKMMFKVEGDYLRFIYL
jgi:hypothetical protein